VARVLEEHETPNGWSFRLALDRHGHPETEHEMTLSWVDHDHWTGGTTPPSRLAERLVAILAARVPQLPARFDAAKARRWAPDVDDLLRRD
jgi:hypothetical protein